MRIALAAILIASALATAQNRPSSEAALTNLPAQKIGPNDLVSINVYDAPEFTRTVRVSADGLIRLPMLRTRLRAQGQLPGELETSIAAALSAEQLVLEPAVTVTVVEYNSRPISVAGAVRNPVTFQAAGPVSLLDAVTRAGGLSPESGTEILVSRAQPDAAGGRTLIVQRIPVQGLIDNADPELNLKLTGGEEIRVPEAGKVFVVGNVKKPGAYPIRDASETSVLKVLAVAEGLAPFASKQAYIYRRDENATARNEIPIELKKIMARRSPDVPLQPNDIFYIPDNSGRRAGISVLERAASFGIATMSGVLIWRR
jgi:polysaccharide export outer membrane protein